MLAHKSFHRLLTIKTVGFGFVTLASLTWLLRLLLRVVVPHAAPLDHPVCSEGQAGDVEKEGVRFRCLVTRRNTHNTCVDEFPLERINTQTCQITVWVTPCSTYTVTLASRTRSFDCTRMYHQDHSSSNLTFEDIESDIRAYIDELCAQLWNQPIVRKFRRRHEEASRGARVLLQSVVE